MLRFGVTVALSAQTSALSHSRPSPLRPVLYDGQQNTKTQMRGCRELMKREHWHYLDKGGGGKRWEDCTFPFAGTRSRSVHSRVFHCHDSAGRGLAGLCLLLPSSGSPVCQDAIMLKCSQSLEMLICLVILMHRPGGATPLAARRE